MVDWNWDAVSAMSSMLGTILILIAAGIAVWQIRESAAARQLEGFLGLMSHLQASSIRKSRRWLRRNQAEIVSLLNDGGKPTERLNRYLHESQGQADAPRDVSELRQDLSVLEQLAALSLSGAIPPRLERSYLAPMLVSYWIDCEPVIIAVRLESGDSLFMQHLEAFSQFAISGRLYGRSAKSDRKRAFRALETDGKGSVHHRAARRHLTLPSDGAGG